MEPEALDRCPWLCSAPNGPNTPFAWPTFFVVDGLRLAMTIGAVVLIGIAVWSIHRSITRGQKARFTALIMLCLTVVGTELDHLGDLPHWRFLVNLVGITLGLWGHYEHLFHELPARVKPRQDPSP